MKAPVTRGGFSLLELLVAAAVTLVLAALMLALTTATLELWRRTQDEGGMVSQAKLVLDTLERDLQAAEFRPDGSTAWLAVDVISVPSALTNHGWRTAARMKPAVGLSERLAADLQAGARFGLSGGWLRLLTTPADTTGGLPCAVSYQLIRRPVSGSVTSSANPSAIGYTLFRSAVAAEATLLTGYDVLGPGYVSASPNPTVAQAPATLTNPANSDALAGNVVDFGVWLYVRDDAGQLRRIFPENEADRSHAARGDRSTADPERYPEVVDVMVRLLTTEGARLVTALEQGSGGLVRPAGFASDDEWWWAVVEAHSQVYVRRIECGGTAR